MARSTSGGRSTHARSTKHAFRTSSTGYTPTGSISDPYGDHPHRSRDPLDSDDMDSYEQLGNNLILPSVRSNKPPSPEDVILRQGSFHRNSSSSQRGGFYDAHAHYHRSEDAPRHVRFTDRHLFEMAAEASTNVSWDAVLRDVVGWRKQASEEHVGGAVTYTKRMGKAYYIKTVQRVAASPTEVRHLLRPSSTEEYATCMRELFGSNFIFGAVAHRAKSKSNQSVSTASVSTQRRRRARLAPTPQIQDVMVKTASFVKTSVFSRNEQACLLDSLEQHEDGNGFTIIQSSMHPDDIYVGKANAHVCELQDLLLATVVERDRRRRGFIRVTFFGQASLQRSSTSSAAPIKHIASKRTIQHRLQNFAACSLRLSMIVRRHRLSDQVLLAHPATFDPSNQRCICCTRSLNIFCNKRRCYLCRYFVCEGCSIRQQVENPTQPDRPKRARLCEHCVQRVDGLPTMPPPSDDAASVKYTTASQPEKRSSKPPAARRASLADMLESKIEHQEDESKQTAAKKVMEDLAILGDNLLDTRGRAQSTAVADLSQPRPPVETRQRARTRAGKVRPTRINADVSSNRESKERQQTMERSRLDKIQAMPELDIICAIAALEVQCALCVVTVVQGNTLRAIASNDTKYLPITLPRKLPFLSPRNGEKRSSQMDVPLEGTDLTFHSGFPLRSKDGKFIGAVCCADTQARNLPEVEGSTMQKLVATASRFLQMALKSSDGRTTPVIHVETSE